MEFILMGAFFIFQGLNLYCTVVFFCRVGGVLIPTRSFGDFLLKSEQDKPAWKQVISVVPQIQTFKLDSCWEFIVVGSDGVWDAMSNAEMTNFVKGRLTSATSHLSTSRKPGQVYGHQHNFPFMALICKFPELIQHIFRKAKLK